MKGLFLPIPDSPRGTSCLSPKPFPSPTYYLHYPPLQHCLASLSGVTVPGSSSCTFGGHVALVHPVSRTFAWLPTIKNHQKLPKPNPDPKFRVFWQNWCLEQGSKGSPVAQNTDHRPQKQCPQLGLPQLKMVHQAVCQVGWAR